MAHPYYHSLSSVKKWGGGWYDYIKIHEWFDETKAHFGDFRHRALRHHSQGIFECERKFGIVLTNSDGKDVMVRQIAEQHVMEDCGKIPTVADWLKGIPMETWMVKTQKIEREILQEITE